MLEKNFQGSLLLLRSFCLVILLVTGAIAGCQTSGEEDSGEDPNLSEEVLRARAKQLAQEMIIADTHIDVPYRMQERKEDIAERTDGGDFDYPRAREGGLDLAFMSIYVPASYQGTGQAKAFADRLIDMVEGFEQQSPNKFAVVRSVEEVREKFGAGLVLLAMGMENGAPIEDDLTNLKYFYDRGIRYITLAHSRSNQISDSSYDPDRQWQGLSPFGKEVVQEMNRLGIMVDISHVSDDAFYDVLEITRAPVIASHSSARHFTPGFERNMDDEMIRSLAENGGVIHINFGSSFINEEYRQKSDLIREKVNLFLRENQLSRDDPKVQEELTRLRNEHPPDFADISDLVAHIDHVVELVGIDHVGLGSDFDGVGDSLPHGLKDVSQYPNLIFELLKKGYSGEDIRKISSGNLLRLWSEVERIAAEANTD